MSYGAVDDEKQATAPGRPALPVVLGLLLGAASLMAAVSSRSPFGIGTGAVSAKAPSALSAKAGEPKNCVCKNGTPVADGCPSATSDSCKACDKGYCLSVEADLFGQFSCVRGPDDYCCVCKHGTAVSPKDCNFPPTAIHNGEVEACDNCHSGYHLSSYHSQGQYLCAKDVCRCDHGTPVDEKLNQCAGEYGKQACASCDDGFRLVDKGGETKCECPPGSSLVHKGEARVATKAGPRRRNGSRRRRGC